MDLPPSGWYPDPYGVPGLLRWWDGSTWTHHTHASGGTDATDGAAESGGGAAQQTTVQPAVQAAAAQQTTVQPAVQPAVRPTTVQPTTVQPGAVQPTTVQPGAGGAAGAGGPQGPDVSGTQVLFLGNDDAWTTPGANGQGGDPNGYYRAQRRRRMWLMGGLAGGTAVALGLVALVVTNLGSSHPSPTASKTPAKPVVVTTPPPSPTPSATPSLTPAATPLTDGTSGLSYTELANWQPSGCPSALSQGFAWSGGESAIAGQVNGGQTTWYGEACSAPLPQQYGYNGVADLENVTTNLMNQFTGQYYNGLPHGYNQGLSQPINISGHAGWEMTYQITYQNAQGQLPFTDEEGVVVVADLGSGVAPAVFFASIPSNLGEGNVDKLVSSLQLSAPIQPGGGGSPGDGSPGPGGSPGDGGGSPGD